MPQLFLMMAEPLPLMVTAEFSFLVRFIILEALLRYLIYLTSHSIKEGGLDAIETYVFWNAMSLLVGNMIFLEN
ncbi:unnamed protein product [Brassica napus]|uniref:(rape) hypothetical protein n=1 Tax=Brassica napus TaxID=3708 RepID=A0A816QGV0_BRANA|nr:unnamed protein product [Brassica napus]